jgi:hypothetical protein
MQPLMKLAALMSVCRRQLFFVNYKDLFSRGFQGRLIDAITNLHGEDGQQALALKRKPSTTEKLRYNRTISEADPKVVYA